MFFNIVRIFFSTICFIVIFIRFEDFNFLVLKNKILEIGLINLIVIFFINLTSLVFIFLRYSFLIKNLNLSFDRRMLVVFNSNLFNIIPIPGLAESVKYFDINYLAGKENSFYILILEKFTSLIIYLILITISLAFLNIQLNFFILFLCILFVTIIKLEKTKNNLPYIGYVFQRLSIYYKNFNFVLLKTFLMSLILQLFSISIPLYIFYALGFVDKSNIIIGFIVIIISNFISSLPISVLGFGVRDVSYFFLGSYFLSIPVNISLIVSTVLNFLVLSNQFISFVIFFFYFLKKKIKIVAVD